MFNRKKTRHEEDIERAITRLNTFESDLYKHINEIESKLQDHHQYSVNPRNEVITTEGIYNKLIRVDKENSKLKAIVNELVDYVYGDKK
jgi:hypothetical protein